MIGRRAPLVAAALVAAALAGCAGSAGSARSAGSAGSAADRLPARWERGLNYASFFHRGYELPYADSALRAARATGTSDVAVVVTWFMDSATASIVAPDPVKTPTDAGVVHAMKLAAALGMRVMLKPQVDVRDGSFRGAIAPADRGAWFAGYAAMVDHYADLARAAGARTLVVGTELTSMARDERAFRRVIAGARARFRGRLTFAANWVEGAERIRFWDAVDVIGIDAYMPVAPGADPSVATLVAGWQRWRERTARLSGRWHRRVLFTELGYESRLGAAAQPYGGNGPVALRPQARAYEAAFRAWRDEAWFGGIYWWEWPADDLHVKPARDGSYSPVGKPAEDVLRRWSR